MPRPITPQIAVDAIIEMRDCEPINGLYPIVLIERKNPPYGWAIPGGFVDVGEWLEDACRREMHEETTLVVTLDSLLGCYSDPSRDQRGHTVGVVYTAHASGEPVAADDAASLRLFDPASVDVPMAFDHADIIEDYVRYRRTGVLPRPVAAGHNELAS